MNLKVILSGVAVTAFWFVAGKFLPKIFAGHFNAMMIFTFGYLAIGILFSALIIVRIVKRNWHANKSEFLFDSKNPPKSTKIIILVCLAVILVAWIFELLHIFNTSFLSTSP